MEDRQQWLSIAAVVLVIGGLGYFLYQRSRQAEPTNNNLSEGVQIDQKANQMLDNMNIDVPEGVDRANLKDVTGGDGTGVATREMVNGKFVHSVIAALPDPTPGTFYEGWLINPDTGDTISTGRFRIAKGGFILDFTSSKDLTDHKQVLVTLEKVDDNNPETHMLEGSFK